MIIAALVGFFASCSNTPQVEERNIYVMTGFREPADTGLRFIYSRDGYHWTDLGPSTFLRPEVGTQKVMRDPSLAVGPDGTFHLVWTSSWKNDYGFGYAHSKDLVNWSKQEHIIVMDHDSTYGNVWAPELFYDSDRDEFSIAWSSASPNHFDGTQRQYYTVTKDFKTFTPAALFYDPGYNSIDGAVMKRSKDDYVLAVKDNRKPGYSDLHLAFGPTPVGPWSNETDTFAPEYSEGPTWVKVQDGWLIYYDAYKQYRYGAHFTNDFKTFTDVSDKISVPKNHKHGTVFMITESQLKVLQDAAERIMTKEANEKAAAKSDSDQK
jgi:Beta-fructosidases (levanase/invertase)